MSRLERKAGLTFAAGILGAVLLFAASAFAGDGDPEWDCNFADQLPQQGMNFCAAEDFRAADQELNAVYKRVRAYMKQTDKDVAEWNEDLVGAEKALLKAQRAWIDYRDGQCEDEGFKARGGSLEPLLVATCMADLTRRRTKELEALMEDM